MKTFVVCIAVCILFTVIQAEEDETIWPSYVSKENKRSTRTRHGYTLITTDLGDGKFKCECFAPNGRQIWPGACGSYDKTLGFINCV